MRCSRRLALLPCAAAGLCLWLAAREPDPLPARFAPPRSAPDLVRSGDVGPTVPCDGDEEWQALVARLEDPRLRRAAEVAIGARAPARVLDDLERRLLRSADAGPRASMARILAAGADPAHSADVRALLRVEADPVVRHAAIGALGRFGDMASADALLALARAGGREARTALFALRAIESEATLQGVAARRHELGPEALAALLQAASAVEQPAGELFEAAREALHRPEEPVRLAAIELLSRAGVDAIDPLLDHALRARDERSGQRAARALLAFERSQAR